MIVPNLMQIGLKLAARHAVCHSAIDKNEMFKTGSGSHASPTIYFRFVQVFIRMCLIIFYICVKFGNNNRMRTVDFPSAYCQTSNELTLENIERCCC